VQIRFCGVRGSTSAPGIDFVRYGGHTACLALSHDDAAAPTLLLDAGAGLLRVSRLLAGAPFAGTILLSHLHWDHTLGLPFFAAGDRVDAQVSVLLPEQENGADAVSVLAGMMSPPYFPIGPTQLRGSWRFDTVDEGEREIEGFSVLAREIPHKGGRTFGYRIDDGRSSLAYLPDHCPTVLGPGPDGFGEYHPAAIELARDVDPVAERAAALVRDLACEHAEALDLALALVHRVEAPAPAQLFPEELAAEADFGHSVADYSVELAKRAQTRSVVLFHHRHDRTDDALDGLARRLGGGSPPVSVAREGELLKL
jgi:phosphoribosyl 1,2-cyclic phosphodiesterase